ncbi:outer envelope pore protein 16, chloroplastic-like isoform X3 [Panicum hallii]|uniref:outer envelope pore protein 16, chloroplastic-like isoform X3 n=1 Tax=Panicum hallii TaxID=206008 RepID=UPI000DF4D402|nr:outer envelope pore protein 16, chloroplastic-like isoform X3 [Panicum hallii]
MRPGMVPKLACSDPILLDRSPRHTQSIRYRWIDRYHRSFRYRSRRQAMPHGGFSGNLTSPTLDLAVDMGHPFLNRTVDGFIKIGTVGACKVAAEETFECLHKDMHPGDVSKHKVEHALKKMCKEGAYWGTIAGVYVGVEYGIDKIRGHRDWKNAMLGGAVTGALISAVNNHQRHKVVKNAITGGAIATAAELLTHLSS